MERTISTTTRSLVQSMHVIEEMTATSLHYNAIIGPVNMFSISEVCLGWCQGEILLQWHVNSQRDSVYLILMVAESTVRSSMYYICSF